MNESVLQNRISMLETALLGKNQEVQICGLLESKLEIRRDKIQAREVKQTAQRHLKMLSGIYRFYKGNTVWLLSQKVYQPFDPAEGATVILKNRQETSAIYAALHNVPNTWIRKCMRSIQEDENKNLRWYQHIADGSRNENAPCGITESRFILMGFGSREEYMQMMNYGKDPVHTVCPDCLETDVHGSLMILPAWKSDLGYLLNEAHRREIQVVPLLKIQPSDAVSWSALGMQLVYFMKQYHLDGVNIDAGDLSTQNIDAVAELVRLIRKKAGCSKTVAVTGRFCDHMCDFSDISRFVDYFVILPEASMPVADLFLDLKVPKDKIVVGMLLCGRYSKMGDPAGDMNITVEDIETLLQQYTAAVRFDPGMMQMNATVIIREWDPPLQICNGRTLTPGVYDIWYDTHETVQCKMEFTRREKLFGTAVWNINEKW